MFHFVTRKEVRTHLMGLGTLKRELEGSSVKESFAETVPPALRL
jgi:hypothetical protein